MKVIPNKTTLATPATGLILKDIASCLKKRKFDAVKLDKKAGVLHIENYGCSVYIEDKIIGISFAVAMDATLAAILTKDIMEYCMRKYEDYTIEIMEPYAHLFDGDGKYLGVLFGDEALEHHYEKAKPSTGSADLEM